MNSTQAMGVTNMEEIGTGVNLDLAFIGQVKCFVGARARLG